MTQGLFFLCSCGMQSEIIRLFVSGRYRIDLRSALRFSGRLTGQHPDRCAEATMTPRLEPVTSFSMGGTGFEPVTSWV